MAGQNEQATTNAQKAQKGLTFNEVPYDGIIPLIDQLRDIHPGALVAVQKRMFDGKYDVTVWVRKAI